MTKASKARVEKKAAAKSRSEGMPPPPAAAGKPTTTSAADGPVSADELDQARDYVQQLVDGKVKPGNRYVRDMLQQLRRAEQGLAQLVPRIDQLQQVLDQAKERRTALSAISQSVGLQLYRWRDDATPEKKGD